MKTIGRFIIFYKFGSEIDVLAIRCGRDYVPDQFLPAQVEGVISEDDLETMICHQMDAMQEQIDHWKAKITLKQ
jgi:hypothetical protein